MNKSKRRFLSNLYDVLYNEANRIIKEHNPCEVSSEGCLGNNFCCDGCKHLGKSGCKVRALGCKLWLCTKAQRKYPDVEERLYILKNIAYKFNLIKFRCDKQETLNDNINPREWIF